MPVTEVKTTNEFNSYITDTNADNKYVIVDFYTNWCGPCKRFAPTYKEFSEKYKNVTFLKVNADDLSEVSDLYKVTALPTFIMFQVGKTAPLYVPVTGADKTKVEAMLKSVNKTEISSDF